MANDTVPASAERAFQPMSQSWLDFDLEDEAQRLWQETASRSGRNAKTLVKHADFRLVLTVLKSNNRIQGHKASGRISIQTVRGHIRMHVSGRKRWRRSTSRPAMSLPLIEVSTMTSRPWLTAPSC